MSYIRNVPLPTRMARRVKKGHVFRRSKPASIQIPSSFLKRHGRTIATSLAMVGAGGIGVWFFMVVGLGSAMSLKASSGFAVLLLLAIPALFLGVALPLYQAHRNQAMERALTEPDHGLLEEN